MTLSTWTASSQPAVLSGPGAQLVTGHGAGGTRPLSWAVRPGAGGPVSVCAGRGHPPSSHLSTPPPSLALCPRWGPPKAAAVGGGGWGPKVCEVCGWQPAVWERVCGGVSEGVLILYMRGDEQPRCLQPTQGHGHVGPSGHRRDLVTLLL